MESKEQDAMLAKHSSDLAVLASKHEALNLLVSTLVTRPEFMPIKLIVYGLVGSILAGVVGALLSTILTK